jgi:hypothetical protein
VALPGFLLVSVVGFCLNGAVMSLGVQVPSLHYLAVQAVAIAMVVSWNFAGAHWILGRGKPSLSERTGP